MNYPLALLTSTVTLLLQASPGDFRNACRRRVCYFRNRAERAPTDEAMFLPGDIDPALCSHIIYYRATLVGNTIVAGDKSDESSSSKVGSFEKVIALKDDEAGLKVILGLDAGQCESGPFYEMATSESSRQQFTANVIDFLRSHNFDGLAFQCDLARERKTNHRTKIAITDVMVQLSNDFDKEASLGSERLQLVFSVYGEDLVNDNRYEINKLSYYVDWIIMWSYHLYIGPQRVTGHRSSLYSYTSEKGSNNNYSVDAAVKHWMSRGAHRDKIVVALSSFGDTYILTSLPTADGAPSKPGRAGPYTRSPGLLAYYEICPLVKDERNGFRYRDPQNMPFLTFKNQWVAYDDISSLSQKVQYIVDQGLGGFAFFALDYDDFTGAYCQAGRFPLLTEANDSCQVD